MRKQRKKKMNQSILCSEIEAVTPFTSFSCFLPPLSPQTNFSDQWVSVIFGHMPSACISPFIQSDLTLTYPPTADMDNYLSVFVSDPAATVGSLVRGYGPVVHTNYLSLDLIDHNFLFLTHYPHLF